VTSKSLQRELVRETVEKPHMKKQPHYTHRGHDMRTCLLLGKTPDEPTYLWDEERKRAITNDRFSVPLIEEPSFKRDLEIDFGTTMSIIRILIDTQFDLGVNPVPVLRLAFPGHHWGYCKTPITKRNQIDDIRASQYIWYFGGGSVVYASPHTGITENERFICSALNHDEVPIFIEEEPRFTYIRGCSIVAE
jgi:hypothetical protein